MDREERTVSMKKRLVSLMLAGLLTLTLTACGGQKSDSPATSGNGDAAPSGTIVLKCGHVLADGSHFDFGVDKFAELVNEKSGGTLQVEVHTDGTLGQEREMMESLQIGNLDLALVSTAPISNFYSQMSVLDMPYLFDSKAHAYAVLDGKIGVGQTGTAKMEMEAFYDGAKDADYIIYVWTLGGKPETLADLLERGDFLEDMKAVKEGNVWCTTPDFFQISSTLGNMINDINLMLNADDTADEFTYLFKLK